MSKSILVIDTPINCAECRFSYKSYNRLGGNDKCFLKQDSPNDALGIAKPDWCPLKKIPEKKSENIKDVGLISSTRNEGWNLCIDEILKGD